MSSSENETAELDAAFERKLATYGELDAEILFRVMPAIIDGTIVAWPANAIGRLRVVRRPGGLLFVTQGLSYPFNDLHADQPERLGYELGIEVGLREPLAPGDGAAFGDVPRETYAASWPARLLWFLADGYVHDRWDLVPRLEHFGVLTTMCTAQPEISSCALPNGAVGLLVGAPIDDDALPDGARLVMLQLLTPDEYEWAIGVEDSSRVHALIEAFRAQGSSHRSSAIRPSVRPLAS